MPEAAGCGVCPMYRCRAVADVPAWMEDWFILPPPDVTDSRIRPAPR